MARAHRVPKSLTLKSHRSNETYGGKREEEQDGGLRDLDPMGSPHIEEKVIGGNVDLDLLSLFPQN